VKIVRGRLQKAMAAGPRQAERPGRSDSVVSSRERLAPGKSRCARVEPFRTVRSVVAGSETSTVIVLTGSPGVGRTTVARILAERARLSVHLHADDFWHFIRQGFVAPYLPESHRQNEVVIDALIAAAFAYAGGGYTVILDGIVGPWFLEPFVRASKSRGVPIDYVVLRSDEQTTMLRAIARTKGELTDPGPVRHMHRQFADLGELERHVIDSTNLTPEETADAIEVGLVKGAFRLVM
jgi:predicted kinase